MYLTVIRVLLFKVVIVIKNYENKQIIGNSVGINDIIIQLN